MQRNINIVWGLTGKMFQMKIALLVNRKIAFDFVKGGFISAGEEGQRQAPSLTPPAPQHTLVAAQLAQIGGIYSKQRPSLLESLKLGFHWEQNYM